jgi:hypothetical protein
MLDFEEGRRVRSGLVEAECPHDAERRRALQGSDEARVPIKEVRLAAPVLHLRRIEEIATGVRVFRPHKVYRDAEVVGGKLRAIGQDLEPSGGLRLADTTAKN